jgi:hypothetical protein
MKPMGTTLGNNREHWEPARGVAAAGTDCAACSGEKSMAARTPQDHLILSGAIPIQHSPRARLPCRGSGLCNAAAVRCPRTPAPSHRRRRNLFHGVAIPVAQTDPLHRGRPIPSQLNQASAAAQEELRHWSSNQLREELFD